MLFCIFPSSLLEYACLPLLCFETAPAVSVMCQTICKRKKREQKQGQLIRSECLIYLQHFFKARVDILYHSQITANQLLKGDFCFFFRYSDLRGDRRRRKRIVPVYKLIRKHKTHIFIRNDPQKLCRLFTFK